MSIKESLRSDLTEAIRGRDEITSSTIRMVLTAITNEEVAGKQARVLSDDEVITVLSREAKKRREASEAFENAGRADKAALEKAEGVVIAKHFLFTRLKSFPWNRKQTTRTGISRMIILFSRCIIFLFRFSV